MAVAAAVTLGVSALSLASPGPAGADPKQGSALVGVGSDTTQDVMNAYAGENFGINYTPVQSSSATGYQQIVSYDATNPTGTGDPCITTKLKSPTMYRANGSGSGRNALSRSFYGGNFGLSSSATPANPACTWAKSISGLVDFARSSSVSSTAGTDLAYVPFGRDLVGLAYYYKDSVSGNVVNGNLSLSKAQITSLYNTVTTSDPASLQTLTGLGVSGGALGGFAGTTKVAPCGIQTGSGTHQFFQAALGGTTGGDQGATTFCRSLPGGNVGTGAGGPGRLQENDGVALKAKGDATPGVLVVIPYSAANFIAQSNLVAKSQLGAGVDFVNISDVVANTSPNRLPYDAAPTGQNPNAKALDTTWYANATFGRDVYNVFPYEVFDPATPNAYKNYKEIFGASGSICTSTNGQTIRSTFGFAAPNDACGTVARTSAMGSGAT